MSSISVLGIYVADLAFFGKSIPVAGETLLGESYVIGPGGKGSNQAVAAAKAGAKTYFISKIGDDQFGSMAIKIYDEAGVDYSKVIISSEHATGAAGILVDQQSGKNAINVVPGAAGALTIQDIDQASNIIKNSEVFLTQFEAPKDVVFYSLQMAHDNNVTTILNPAPAASIDQNIFPLIDKKNSNFELNRSKSSMKEGSDLSLIETKISLKNLVIHMYVDVSVIEIFLNYKKIITSRIYPNLDSKYLEIYSAGGHAKIDMKLWSMGNCY